jgi:hypothetical protein
VIHLQGWAARVAAVYSLAFGGLMDAAREEWDALKEEVLHTALHLYNSSVTLL